MDIEDNVLIHFLTCFWARLLFSGHLFMTLSLSCLCCMMFIELVHHAKNLLRVLANFSFRLVAEIKLYVRDIFCSWHFESKTPTSIYASSLSRQHMKKLAWKVFWKLTLIIHVHNQKKKSNNYTDERN